MSKLMSVDILSSIKGAKPSETVNKLFEVIKNAQSSSNKKFNANNRKYLSLNDLREDNVEESSAEEKKIIMENFPKTKNGYLVVNKIIE